MTNRSLPCEEKQIYMTKLIADQLTSQIRKVIEQHVYLLNFEVNRTLSTLLIYNLI